MSTPGSDGLYSVDEIIVAQATFTSSVKLDPPGGRMGLGLNVAGKSRKAWSAPSSDAASEWRFSYRVTAIDRGDTDGVSVPSGRLSPKRPPEEDEDDPADAEDAELVSAADAELAASLTHLGYGPFERHYVQARPALPEIVDIEAVSSPPAYPGVYVAVPGADRIVIRVHFSEVVTAAGEVVLHLRVPRGGDSERAPGRALLVSGSGTRALDFAYTVRAEDDGETLQVAAGALELASGAYVRDWRGERDALVTHAGFVRFEDQEIAPLSPLPEIVDIELISEPGVFGVLRGGDGSRHAALRPADDVECGAEAARGSGRGSAGAN